MNLSMDVNQDINISYMKKYIFDEISSLHDHQKIIHLAFQALRLKMKII